MKHVVAGLILVAIGLWGMVTWWDSFGFVMRGLVPIGILGLGLIATLSGYYRLAGRRDDYEDDHPETKGPRRG
jgi:hypothetical protein